jgi:exo-beta-1,3-glucanase (GH17 family)
MNAWSEEEKITIFFFEAFDEPWKGSNDPDEPEKHWGIYDVNRKKK